MTTNTEVDASTAHLDRRSRLVVLTVALAALIAVVDGTIVTASLQTIAADLGTGLQTAVWFTSAYLLAAGTTMPLSGWLMERFGVRRVFFVALIGFVVGSVLCALAWSPAALIVFRVAQGLGGGLLEPAALTIAATTAGPQRMGKVMGALSGVINVAPVLGPLAGGFLAGTGSWEWIFLINLPLGVLVLGGAIALLRGTTDHAAAARRPDLLGLVMLPAAFVLLLLASERISSAGSAVPALLAVGGVIVLAAWVWRARRAARQSVIDLDLLRNRGFRAGLLVMAVVGFTMYFQLVALALYSARALGWHGTRAGLVVASLGAGLLVSMTLSGRASDRVGSRRIVTLAAASTAIMAVVLAALHDRIAIGVLLGLLVVLGLAFGSVAAPAFSSVYRSVPGDKIARATPALFMTVQLGAATGASVAALLMDRLAAGTALTAGYLSIAVLTVLARAIARALPGPPAP